MVDVIGSNTATPIECKDNQNQSLANDRPKAHGGKMTKLTKSDLINQSSSDSHNFTISNFDNIDDDDEHANYKANPGWVVGKHENPT